MSDLKWTKTMPNRPGTYFRTTLWGRSVKVEVSKMDREGQTCLLFQGPTGGLFAPQQFDDRMYWFGPIPEPPSDADWVAKQAKPEPKP